MKTDTKPASFRLSLLAVKIIDKLQPILGLNKTGIIEIALRELAVKYGVLSKPTDRQEVTNGK